MAAKTPIIHPTAKTLCLLILVISPIDRVQDLMFLEPVS